MEGESGERNRVPHFNHPASHAAIRPAGTAPCREAARDTAVPWWRRVGKGEICGSRRRRDTVVKRLRESRGGYADELCGGME